MQVEVDVVCMYTNFCGHGISSFGDIVTFQNWPNFPFGPWTVVKNLNQIKSAQKIHASRG